MGAGKTSVAREISRTYELPMIDTDAEIEKIESIPAHEVFRTKGEPYFRDVESAALLGISRYRKSVIATGGGIVMRPENRERLKLLGTIFFLNTPETDILTRINPRTRPALLGQKSPKMVAKQLYRVRLPIYNEISDHTIYTKEKSINTIASEIWEIYESKSNH